MRVLVADKLPSQTLERLTGAGFDVSDQPMLKGDDLVAAIGLVQPQVLVVRSTKVNAEMLRASDTLNLVVRGGAGVNTIDLDTCSTLGICVANCPGKNAIAVAELTLGLALALDRKICDNVIDLRAHKWNKKAYSTGRGLNGRTLGLLGLGRIGIEVAKLGQNLGMDVVAWSRSLTQDKAKALGIRAADTPEEVAKQSYVLSVHLAACDETRALVNASLLQHVPEGAIFLNTSRSEVVDEAALLARLNDGMLWAGLDVFSQEPATKEGEWTHPLAVHPRVYGTHHIGASTAQAQEAVGDEVCRIVETFRDRGRVLNCVNLSDMPQTPVTLVVRHLDRVGVLAGVLTTLQTDGISVGTMENLIFKGNEAAVARIQLRDTPSTSALELIQKQASILSISLL